MTKHKFFRRKLWQLGNAFDLDLINAANPAELFCALLKYRGNEAELTKDKEQAFLAYVLKNFDVAKAQIFQDLFVLFMTNEKRQGYFVEFGATNGVTLSNSYLLEKSFGWDGILAEPARCWHHELSANRNCKIEPSCVWSKSGEQLEFNEVSSQELSTINTFSESDGRTKERKNGKVYLVETISLNDLLEKHGAPHEIDFLSVDTEGSELTILSNFDFQKYNINIITVEHNFTKEREKIHHLLGANGYKRVFENFSNWDDWYTKV
jgi:FkbM family methyltransferase